MFVYRRTRFSTMPIIVLIIVFSFSFMIGIGGQPPQINVMTEEKYYVNNPGHIYITITNSWWTRDITVKEVSLDVEIISFNYDVITNLPIEISSGDSITIEVIFTPRSYVTGTFNYYFTIFCSQNIFLVFGSQSFQLTPQGEIDVKF